MEKNILISVSPYIQKYYFNEKYKELPGDIKDELMNKLAIIAENTQCIISLGFDEWGEIFLEERHEDPVFYDDIGAALEIKEFQAQELELLKALKMWHMLYCTQNGKIIREILILQSKKVSREQVLKVIEEKYGAEARQFAKDMLEDFA